MKQFVGLVIFVPLAILVGVFAVENSTTVSVHVWPFGGALDAWVSVWILGLLATGLVIGILIGWLAGMGWRRRARRAERQVRTYERQMAEREEAETRAAERAEPGAALPAPEQRSRRTALLGD